MEREFRTLHCHYYADGCCSSVDLDEDHLVIMVGDGVVNCHDVRADKIAIENNLIYIAQDSSYKIEFGSIFFKYLISFFNSVYFSSRLKPPKTKMEMNLFLRSSD